MVDPVVRVSDLPASVAPTHVVGITGAMGNSVRIAIADLVALLGVISSPSHLGYDTLAHLNANLTHPARTIAEVLSDPTSSNNGIYIKVGDSGTGSWSKISDLPSSVLADMVAGLTVTGSGLATGGGTLPTNPVINVPKASLTDAADGVDDTKAMTPYRTKWAVDAQRPMATQQDVDAGTVGAVVDAAQLISSIASQSGAGIGYAIRAVLTRNILVDNTWPAFVMCPAEGVYFIGRRQVSVSDIVVRSGISKKVVAPDGTFTIAYANSVAFDYTHGRRRMLVEGSATNLFVGSAAPTGTQGITVTVQTYVVSFWGSGTVTLNGAFIKTVTGAGPNVRTEFAFTPAAGTLNLSITGAVLRIQVEATAAGEATSYIETTTHALTRPADLHQFSSDIVARVSNTATLASRFRRQIGVANYVVYAINTSNNNSLQSYFSAGTLRFGRPGAETPRIDFLPAELPEEVAMCSSWSNTGLTGSVNGSTPITNTTGASGTTTALYIGGVSGPVAGSRMDIDEIVVWPITASNTAVQGQAVVYIDPLVLVAPNLPSGSGDGGTTVVVTSSERNRNCSVIGDSISATGIWNTSTQQHKLDDGWQTWLSILTDRAVEFPIEFNFAAGGAQTSTVVASQLDLAAACSASTVHVLVGTNDAAADRAVSSVLTRYALIRDTLLAAGKRIIWATSPPRGSIDFPSMRLTTGQMEKLATFRRWVLAQSETAGVYPYDTWPFLENASGVPGDYIDIATHDGVHPAPVGAYLMARAAEKVTRFLFPPRYVLPISAADTYSATNTGGNLVNNPFMLGTSGTKSGGAMDGTVANGFNVRDGANGVIVSVSAYTDAGGIAWQQVVLTGTPTADGEVEVSFTLPHASMDAAAVYESVAYIDLIGGHFGIDYVTLQLSISSSVSTKTARDLGKTPGDQDGLIPEGEHITGIWRTPPMQPSGAPTAAKVSIIIGCVTGIPVGATVNMRAFSVRATS